MKRFALFAVAALALAGCSTPAPPPVSDKVQHALEAARTRASESVTSKAVKVTFIGESYTAGAGATNQHGWVKLLSAKNNWSAVNLGRGGTGYLKTIASGGVNACGAEVCPNYLTMADKAIESKPDVVIVAGGRNDGAALTPDLASNVTAVFSKLRAGLSAAKIIALNPIWAAESPQPDSAAFGEAVRAGVTAAGGSFVSIGAPLEGHPEMITKDNVHPNDAGHQHLADVVGEALAGAKLP
ncbi:SGNH/GDSL hydrolase family protein [Arthrobacter sp. ISL-72]|uniref:SGNH/GDSL hydrolase family protein n=1 Tax=Arthrobacter sp. ISL-72 TaxID=2819114 RepID=UPI001BE6635E|nr:SGNH/GDSL hydrolase family protein [Arthrobacter sp. ISL-72]MBT2594668.1 SGNH/GDSL hydrolase family protein [Arthrobacter sp. ISL-72]